MPKDHLAGQVMWLPDGQGWLIWLTRTAVRAEPRVPGGNEWVAVEYKLLEGRLGRAGVRTLLAVPEQWMFPAMVGTLADGSTLAVESVRAEPPARADMRSGGAVAGPVVVSVSAQSAEGGRSRSGREAVRIQERAVAKVHLVTFPGADAERVRRDVDGKAPPHASFAELSLSPDGKRLAWFAGTVGAMETPSPLLRELIPRARYRKIREGSSALYVSDLSESGAGKFRMVGVVRGGDGGPSAPFWWGKDKSDVYLRPVTPSS